MAMLGDGAKRPEEPSMVAKDSNEVKVNPGEEDEEAEEEEDWSSDSEIGDALDWLDLKDDDEGGIESGAITLNARRPNAHGGALSRPASSTLQPLSNRTQKFANHIRASPLELLIFTY
uniref:Uncharacterized protein n=1 Tax=Opuntia streptacantha TaxID=393608 RepID=A0A7C8ZSH8_OPUST